MIKPLLPSLDLIDRTLRIETSYTISRMRVLESLPGNPVGIAFREVGGSAIALMAKHFPNPHFNKVVGLRGGQEAAIAGLAAWYRGHGIRPRFEMLPRDGDEPLGRELVRLGFYPSEFHTSLVRDVTPMPPAERADAVEQVTTPAAMEAFLDAYAVGWAIPGDPEDFKRNVRGWLGRPGWSLFLARDEGRPAASAMLYIADDVAYLADATCDPAFRRKGLHAALLERRITEAVAAGVDFICSGAAFLSASHRNMTRAGMTIQFNRAIWRERL